MRPRPRIAFFRNAAYREILDLKGKREGRTTVVDFSNRGSDKDKRTAQWLMNEWTQFNLRRKRIFGHDAFLSSYYGTLNLIQAENGPFVFIFNLKKWALFIGHSQCLMSKITFATFPIHALDSLIVVRQMAQRGLILPTYATAGIWTHIIKVALTRELLKDAPPTELPRRGAQCPSYILRMEN